MPDFEYRVAGGDWTPLENDPEDEDPINNVEDDTVVFMMEERGCDYVTYDGEVPYLPGVSGKVEYRRIQTG